MFRHHHSSRSLGRSIMLAALCAAIPGCLSTEDVLTVNGSLEKLTSFKGESNFSFTSDGAGILGAGERYVFRWTWQTGALERIYDGNPYRIDDGYQSVAMSSDGRWIVGGGGQLSHYSWGTRRPGAVIWDAESGQAVDSISVGAYDDDHLTAITFNADGTKIGAAFGANVYEWSGANGVFDRGGRLSPDRHSLAEWVGDLMSIEYSSDGSRILTSPAVLWNASSLEIIDEFYQVGGERNYAAFIRNGSQIVMGGELEVNLVDAATREIVGTIPNNAYPDINGDVETALVVGIAASRDGSLFATVDDHEQLMVFDGATGELIARETLGYTPWMIRFSPDGQTIAVSAIDRTITFWRVHR